jgi:hypothetical protein
MFADLMARFPESATSFRADLLGSGAMPELSESEAETVCRILLEMPEIGTWREDARRVFRKYPHAAEVVLNQEAQGTDQDKSWQAQAWLNELRRQDDYAPVPRTRRRTAAAGSDAPMDGGYSPPPVSQKRAVISEPSSRARGPNLDDYVDTPAPVPTTAARLSQQVNTAPLAAPPASYTGPFTGTLISSGGPIPQNAEYVFRGLPPGKIQLDYDTNSWEARVAAGVGNTQRIIVKNKTSGPQKRCVVKWTLIP